MSESAHLLQEPDSTANEQKQHSAPVVKAQHAIQSLVSSQPAQLKNRQCALQPRQPLTVLSQASNAAVKGEQHTGKLIKQPAPRIFHLGMFEVRKALGKGKFGRVYLAHKQSTGFVCALKVLHKSKIQQGRVEKQVAHKIEIQSNLRHPNVLRLFSHFDDSKRIILILEYAGKGELYKHLQREDRFPEWKSAQYIAQMANALLYLHRKHVIHRDIKPENILVGIHGELKMSDFGWSVHAPSGRRHTQCGTLDYLPPEMVDPRKCDKPYDQKVDIWSLGVLLYEFLVGRAPFEDTPVMTQRRIAKGDMTVPSFVSPEAKDLIKKSVVLSTTEISLGELATTVEAIPRKYSIYTQELGLSIPIHKRVVSLCVHLNGDDRDISEVPTEEDDIFYEWTDHEDTNDEHPGEESPEKPEKTGINSLITDGECGSSMNTQYRVDLVQFKDLKALAWRGLNRYSDFESIKDCFSTLGHQLSSLTLDLVNWDRAMKIWADGFRRQSTQDIPDNFFAQNVLNISPRDNGVHFQSLKYLHLSGVSLCHVEAQMLHSFNIESIKSLELRNCPGSLDLLQQALTPRKTLKLRELELSLDINSLQRPAHVRSTQIICEFIQHVNHLEVLHLMLPEPFDWDSLAFTISTCTCLKSLVTHHLIDRGGQNLIDGGIPWPSYLGDVLQAKELTCFGSSTPPDELVRASASCTAAANQRDKATQLRKAQRRPSCRLLHIRASGVVLERLANQSNWSSAPVYNFKYGDDPPYGSGDILRFAEWAFSVDGLPNLEILAWGDFSYGGRYSKFNVILGKVGGDGGYRGLALSNVAHLDILENNMGMLAACPLDDIIK
ncbi:hypothetical protein ACP6JC_007288 [Aspergillus fumigatus]